MIFKINKHNLETEKANHDYSKKNFKKALENYLSGFYGDHDPSFLHARIGICYIYLKEYGKSELHLKKALEDNPYNIQAIAASAYLDLFYSQSHMALNKYAKILKLKPNNIFVKRLLKQINKIDNIEQFVMEKKIEFFIPLFDNPGLPDIIDTYKKPIILTAGALILVILLLAIIHLNIGNIIKSNNELATNRILEPNPDLNSKDFQDKITSIDDVYLFDPIETKDKEILSKDVVNYFNKMKEYIKNRQVNEAIVIYNKVIQSDVNIYIKEKFDILQNFIPTPHFNDFKQKISLETLTSDPVYNNVYIKYIGYVSKINQAENYTRFNFTVVENKNFEGTIEIHFSPPLETKLKREQQYIVFGKYLGFNKYTKKIAVKGLVIQIFR